MSAPTCRACGETLLYDGTTHVCRPLDIIADLRAQLAGAEAAAADLRDRLDRTVEAARAEVVLHNERKNDAEQGYRDLAEALDVAQRRVAELEVWQAQYGGFVAAAMEFCAADEAEHDTGRRGTPKAERRAADLRLMEASEALRPAYWAARDCATTGGAAQ